MFEVWLELGGAPGDDALRDRILGDIERYNRDDVLSTWRLRAGWSRAPAGSRRT